MVNLGSKLYAQNLNYNGEIGCSVQSSNTWVLTSFQALSTNSRVIIMGYIDIGGSVNTYLSVREIISYNNTHDTNIRTNGFIIDYLYDGSTNSPASMTLGDYNTMNINT